MELAKINKAKGFIYIILSSLIFGATPILAKYTFIGGSNALMLTFFRAVIPLPFLYLIVRLQGDTIKIPKKQFFQVCILAVFGSSLTTITLYSTYSYISVGMATTIHYVYPSVVTIFCVLVLKEKVSKLKITALLLSTAGICLFYDGKPSGSFLGLLAAFASGMTFAFYLIYMVKTGLTRLNTFKLTFYTCLVNAFVLPIYGAATSRLTFSLTSKAWIFSVIVALFVSIGAVSLLQLGVKYIGPSTSSILFTLEPITSVILGILILKENFSINTAIGCTLVILSVIMVALNTSRSEGDLMC